MREEIQRDKLRSRAGRRAWAYEKRLDEGRGSELARKCLEEIKARGKIGKVGVDWEERKEFFEYRGWKLEEIEMGHREEVLEAILSKERQ